jgi:hypothetical protein
MGLSTARSWVPPESAQPAKAAAAQRAGIDRFATVRMGGEAKERFPPTVASDC